MKKFNKAFDMEMNELAVAYANGDQVAGEKFIEKVQPLMERYAAKQYSLIEGEDLAQEFLIVAIEKAIDFAERYNDGKNNVMGLIYKSCRNRLIDINKAEGAEKRSLYKDREVSLQSLVGEDSDMSMSEKVADDQKSVEDQVLSAMESKHFAEVVEEYVSTTKGRNGKIVLLTYVATRQDWASELLNSEIEKVIEKETGKTPNAASVRQAKSRALKAFRKAIESGKIANQLGLGL